MEPPYRKSAKQSLPLAGGQHNWARRIALAIVSFSLFIIIGMLGYRVLQPERSMLDALYMTVITVTTVGYQEVYELSDAGRLWTIFVIFGGLLVGAITMSLVAAMVVEGQVRSIFGRRQLERRIAALKGHVIVCGYGRLGRLVADELVSAGRDVVIVDKSPDRTQMADASDLPYVLGSAEDEGVLHTAGIDRAGFVVTVLPTDAANLFVTLSARETNPELKIISQAIEASTQSKLRTAGATRVVCPRILGAAKLAAVVLRPAVADYFEVAGRGVELEMDQFRIPPDAAMVGKSLMELSLPKQTGAQVCAIQREGIDTMYQPDPELVLEAGDVLVMVGKKGIAQAIRDLDAILGDIE